jgi:hypothetical protein
MFRSDFSTRDATAAHERSEAEPPERFSAAARGEPDELPREAFA